MTQRSHKSSSNGHKRSFNSLFSTRNLIVLVIVVGLLALSAGLTYRAEMMKNVPNGIRPGLRIQTVSAERTYSVELKNAYVDTALTQKFHLPSTQRVVVYDISVKNNSSKKLYVTPALQLFLRDNEGDYYQLLADVVKNPLKPGAIESGQTTQGEVAFVIMNRKMPLWLYFDTGWENRGPVVFDGTI